MIETFPLEVQQFVREEIASGAYATERELILDAVQRLQGQARLDRIKAELKRRAESLDRGEGIELKNDEELQAFFDEIADEGDRRIAEKAAKGRPGT